MPASTTPLTSHASTTLGPASGLRFALGVIVRAALDPLGEERLYQDFARLSSARTVVLVTHRLAAARIATRIAVFDAGRVVQTGSHADLLTDGDGLYARMWAAQSGWAR